MSNSTNICGIAVAVGSGFPRICRLQNEYYDQVANPTEFIAHLKTQKIPADLFTFIQDVTDTSPRYKFHHEWDVATVLPLTTFEHWWKKQVNDKTRNMVRKATKAGVDIRPAAFDVALVRGIHIIYNECPVRQGRPFKHFGKDVETIRREHATYLDRSEFFGAYFGDELIGFIKLVHGNGVSNLMNIVSMICHRDKAPTNALIAKAVEICTAKGVPFLQYGTGNQGSIGEFKKHSAFEARMVPRYYVPLNFPGTVALKMGLHRPLKDRIPENISVRLKELRARWAKPVTNKASLTAPVKQPAQVQP